MKNTLTNHPGRAATVFGWFYFFAQQVPIPILLAMAFEIFHLPASNLWMNFAFFCFNFTVVILVYHRYLGAALAQLGKRFGHVLGDCVACFLLYMAANVFVSVIITLCFPSFANANDANIQSMANDRFWVTFVGTVLLAPLAEEVLFRGVIFGSLYRLNRPMAYIFSTLLFGSVHIIGYLFTDGYTWTEAAVSLLQYLPAGLCLGWVYADTNTIFAPVLVHTTVNLIAVMAMR